MALIKEINSFELPNFSHSHSLISNGSTRESFDDIERCCSLDFDTENSEIQSPEIFPTIMIMQLCQKKGVRKPKEEPGLFQQLSSTQKSKIENLNYKLDLLMNALEDRFEAINVRDDCSLKPKPIELATPGSSFISKRRATLPCNVLRV
ncbi:unnamed protein product [Blepharisma stoltei]|uniref:Uncharacterized protein n=1 Tax=Blepharisma stoltei TaxID=1481888 RepID=A0AAU9J6K0_9CILI|nr:unnamed protein product [Blepharisma stoltei]